MTGPASAAEKPASNRLNRWRTLTAAFSTPAAWRLFFLGFGSGLPFLLVGATVFTWMREGGLDLKTIGLLSLPGWFYVLKFLWAPLLDRFSLPFLGRRRGYLFVSHIGIALGLWFLATLSPVADLTLFTWALLWISFFGATQDIVVDAYRIEIAPIADQAALAATSGLGYRIGLIASGAGVLYLADLGSWSLAYQVMGALMIIPAVVALLSPEPVGAPRRREHWVAAFYGPFLEFFKRSGLLTAIILLCFIGLYKFPDQAIGVLSGPFYLDSGYTKTDIATVSKVYGVWLGIAGAFCGGAVVMASSLRWSLLLAAIAVAVSNLAYLLMSAFPSQLWAFYAAITADNFSQGFAGVVLVAFLSALSHRAHTATQFALMVSLANLPGKFAGALSGYIVDPFGYPIFFLLTALSIAPALLMLALLWTKLEVGSTLYPNYGTVNAKPG